MEYQYPDGVDLSNLNDLQQLFAALNRVTEHSEPLKNLNLSGNRLEQLPQQLIPTTYNELLHLDVSNNRLSSIDPCLRNLPHLKHLDAHNNRLDESTDEPSLDSTAQLEAMPLQCLNLGANQLIKFPLFIYSLTELTKLHLGANRIEQIPVEISHLQKLEYLYLGGNRLETVPIELGNLIQLVHLNLSDNRLTSVPTSLGRLTELRCLELHTNRLQTLPSTIIRLDKLEVISLRNNPLVVAFAQQSAWTVPSLTELSGRRCLQFIDPLTLETDFANRLPWCIRHYLSSARTCENPSCRGVYFSHCVEEVKFSDFCGRYRLPMAQFLCSPQCSDDGPESTESILTVGREHGLLPRRSESDEESSSTDAMRRVLMG